MLSSFHIESGFSQIDRIGIRGFTTWKTSSDKIGFFTNRQNWQYWHQRLYYVKKIQWQMLPPVGKEPGPLIASDSKSNTILSTLPWHLLARLRLGSSYSHALLIPLKSSKSKYQVVHEQKFKDLSSTCHFRLIFEKLEYKTDKYRESKDFTASK